MNKKLATLLGTLLILPSAVTHATAAGGYIGLGLGESDVAYQAQNMQISSSSLVEKVTPSTTGIGARLFGGYYFNPYVGLEAGATYFAPVTYESVYLPSCAKNSIDTYALDFAIKGMIPFGKFNVFAKGGIADIYGSGLTGFGTSTTTTSCNSATDSATAIRGELGAGVSYDFTPNVVVDLSANEIQKSGKLAEAKLYALSVSYHFVDKYCGQFLC